MNPDPAKLRLVTYPHKALSQKAEPFPIQGISQTEIQPALAYAERLKVVLRSMGERGIGLAANQIGLLKRVFVAYADLNTVSESKQPPSDLQAYINPVILSESGEPEPYQEGCLSFPGIRGNVMRRPRLTLGYYDESGKWQQIETDGLHARCCRHEIDHLDGINIIDKFDLVTFSENAAAIKRLKARG